jgi:hypothetical protein
MLLAPGSPTRPSPWEQLLCGICDGRHTPKCSAHWRPRVAAGQADRAVELLQQIATRFPYTEAHRRTRVLADALPASSNRRAQLSITRNCSIRLCPPPQQGIGSFSSSASTALCPGRFPQQAKSMLFALVAGEEGARAAEAYSAPPARSIKTKDRRTSPLPTSGKPLLLPRQRRQAGSPTSSLKAAVLDALPQYTLLAQLSQDDNERRNFRARAIVASLRIDDIARADKGNPRVPQDVGHGPRSGTV